MPSVLFTPQLLLLCWCDLTSSSTDVPANNKFFIVFNNIFTEDWSAVNMADCNKNLFYVEFCYMEAFEIL